MSFWKWDYQHQDELKRKFDSYEKYEWREKREGYPEAILRSPYHYKDNIRTIVKMTCAQCGYIIYGDIHAYNSGLKYCSYQCANDAATKAQKEAREQARHKVCPICGKEFTAARKDAKYCSPACKQKAYRKGGIAEQPQQAGPVEYHYFRSITIGEHEIKVLEYNGQSWYEAQAICDILGFPFASVAVRYYVLDYDCITFHHDETIDTLVNHAGLYALLLACDKPEAKIFRQTVVKKAFLRPGKKGSTILMTPEEKQLCEPEYGIQVLMEIWEGEKRRKAEKCSN